MTVRLTFASVVRTLIVGALSIPTTLFSPRIGAAALQDAPAGMTALPDTNQGRCVRAFLDMIADPTPLRVEAFESKHRSAKRLSEVPMDERVRRAREVRDRMGKLTLTEVSSIAEDAVTIVTTNERGDAVELQFLFDAAQDRKLDGIRISLGPVTSGPAAPLSGATREELVEAVARAVGDHYVYPEIGVKMAETVRTKLKSGAYDALKDDTSLCRQLTDDLRAVSNDRHLGVRPEPRIANRGDGPGVDEIAGDNSGFRKVEILPGNIGYLRFDAFVKSEQAFRTATAALGFLEHCDALIFDLRRNGGGDPESIRFITSYLFDAPTHLNDMVDRSGKVVEEFWTLESVPGQRFAPGLPVFILTSAYTFSGAEEFSYNLQSLKRGTVVGEKTGGGAHPVRGVRVSDRVVVGVPFMRARNPITGTNWEGIGVQPDVATSADEALERAAQLAHEAIKARKVAAKAPQSG